MASDTPSTLWIKLRGGQKESEVVNLTKMTKLGVKSILPGFAKINGENADVIRFF